MSVDQAISPMHQLIAKLHLKLMKAYSSFLLVYQLMTVPTLFRSGNIAKVNCRPWRGRE